jgi:hypothetical protein
LVAVFLAAFRDYTPYLGAGEVATIAVIAANRMQARSIFRYVLGLLEAVPALKAMIKDDTADQITLNNRVVLEIHTASFRVTRGYTLAAALCDETVRRQPPKVGAVCGKAACTDLCGARREQSGLARFGLIG